MKVPARLRPDASDDIERQGEYYLERAGLAVFLRFHEAIEKSLEMLSAQPLMGEQMSVSKPDLLGIRASGVFPDSAST